MSACPVPRHVPGLRVLAFAVVLLSGCSTAQIDSIPQELGGLPAGTPARPAEAPAYPAVHDMPPRREAGVLDAEQQKKLEADLIAIRNRQPNQQKNIARAKAKAEKQAKRKAAGANKDKSAPGRQKAQRPAGQTAPQAGAAGQPASGVPPWPLPPQTTGGSSRP